MYVIPQSQELRQGDILDKVWFTPTTFYQLKDEQFTIPLASLRRAHLVVISHCCELTWFDNEQGKPQPRRPYVLVAPLSLNLPFSKESDEYKMLIENGVNKPENDPIQYFYYENTQEIGAEAIVDFSTMTSIRNGSLKNLGLRRVLELDVKHRHLFRTKLHEYFSRIPEEEWEIVKTLFPDDFS